MTQTKDTTMRGSVTLCDILWRIDELEVLSIVTSEDPEDEDRQAIDEERRELARLMERVQQ